MLFLDDFEIRFAASIAFEVLFMETTGGGLIGMIVSFSLFLEVDLSPEFNCSFREFFCLTKSPGLV